MTSPAYKKILRCRSDRTRRGFSLVEIVTVLIIATMLVMATISVYSRTRTSAEKINSRLDENTLATEILQRIAEDLDRLAIPGFDTTIEVTNKFDEGYNVSQLVIEKKFYGIETRAKPQTFEKIIWQTNYDSYEDALILYRAHSGVNLEDRTIDADESSETSLLAYQKRQDVLFIPLASGITFFKIQAMSGGKVLDRWSSIYLPKAIVATLSFAAPFETVSGELEVEEERKITRTIAVDRTRKIRYKFVRKEFDDEDFEPEDPNDIGTTDVSDADMDTDMDDIIDALEDE